MYVCERVYVKPRKRGNERMRMKACVRVIYIGTRIRR